MIYNSLCPVTNKYYKKDNKIYPIQAYQREIDGGVFSWDNVQFDQDEPLDWNSVNFDEVYHDEYFIHPPGQDTVILGVTQAGLEATSLYIPENYTMAYLKDEVPIGCVIVKDNEIIKNS